MLQIFALVGQVNYTVTHAPLKPLRPDTVLDGAVRFQRSWTVRPPYVWTVRIGDVQAPSMMSQNGETKCSQFGEREVNPKPPKGADSPARRSANRRDRCPFDGSRCSTIREVDQDGPAASVSCCLSSNSRLWHIPAVRRLLRLRTGYC